MPRLLPLLLFPCLLLAEESLRRGPLVVDVGYPWTWMMYQWALEDATVELVGTGRTWQTCSSGVCIIDSLTSVNNALLISKPGRATGAFMASLIDEGPAIVCCTLPYELPKYVVGTIRDFATGQPIADASVLVFSADEIGNLRMGPFMDTTDSAGRYLVLLESIPMYEPPERFWVLSDHRDYLAMSEERSADWSYEAGFDTAVVDMKLEKMPRSSVVGKVTDERGRPVPLLRIRNGHHYYSIHEAWGAWTDLDGNYEMHTGPGTREVHVGRSFTRGWGKVKVRRGRPARLDLNVTMDSLGSESFYEVGGIAYHDDPRRRHLSSVLPSLHLHRKSPGD